MGTRNLTIVYYKGKYRIMQYGHWDGYPSGQGLTVLRFVSDPSNIKQLKVVLDAGSRLIVDVTDNQGLIDEFKDHPSLNAAAEILQLALQATEETPMPVVLDRDFLADSTFCEWVWLVDLDHDALECYHRYYHPKDRAESRFEDILDSRCPCPRLIVTFPFSKLPATEALFVKMCGQKEEEEG